MPSPDDGEPRSTLAACKLTCNPEASLWPKPREIVHLSKAFIDFQPGAIKLERISAPTAQVRLIPLRINNALLNSDLLIIIINRLPT